MPDVCQENEIGRAVTCATTSEPNPLGPTQWSGNAPGWEDNGPLTCHPLYLPLNVCTISRSNRIGQLRIRRATNEVRNQEPSVDVDLLWFEFGIAPVHAPSSENNREGRNPFRLRDLIVKSTPNLRYNLLAVVCASYSMPLARMIVSGNLVPSIIRGAVRVPEGEIEIDATLRRLALCFNCRKSVGRWLSSGQCL